MKKREGDFLEISDHVIFEVKGLLHPPRHTIAYPRYVSEPKGDRFRDSLRYKKIEGLTDAYRYIEGEYPGLLIFDHVFNEYLCEVEDTIITKYRNPVERLSNLRELQKPSEIEVLAFKFAELLKSGSNIGWENLGISGSLLVGLWTPDSDIDMMVYGSKESRSVISMMRQLQNNKESGVTAYTKQDLIRLYQRHIRDTRMPFEPFLWHQSRKSFQGRFQNREFFIRFVKDWSEITEAYGDTIYTPMEYARVKARVIDDSDAIFTPCTYGVKQIKVLEGHKTIEIEEIASFRGRFCEQAKEGEEVEVQGKVETLITKQRKYQRILIGGKPTDYLMKV